DIVRYYVHAQIGDNLAKLSSAGSDRRREYLERFADREGRHRIEILFSRYHGLDLTQAMSRMTQNGHWTAARLAAAYYGITGRPDGQEFERILEHALGRLPSDRKRRSLASRYGPHTIALARRSRLCKVPLLELWLIGYLHEHPGATLRQTVAASAAVRDEDYGWLFRTRRRKARDRAVRIMLEVDAFRAIHARWRRLGYPFDRLVPSYATAIGSSADRPEALAELVGIIVNDGVRLPVSRLRAIEIGGGTPFETRFEPVQGAGQRVLSPDVALAAAAAMRAVVDRGTARRLNRMVPPAIRHALPIGGKTGTGDHRYKVFDSAGRLLASRPVNRAATFVFSLGNRYFGTVTAYVTGKRAAGYRFTSSLPVAILGLLVPRIERFLTDAEQGPAVTTACTSHPTLIASGAGAPSMEGRHDRDDVSPRCHGSGVFPRVTAGGHLHAPDGGTARGDNARAVAADLERRRQILSAPAYRDSRGFLDRRRRGKGPHSRPHDPAGAPRSVLLVRTGDLA
ncbi:MAG: hypothetical protein ACE5HU_10350, partial [Acidobacteriota bacterium]